MTLAPCAQGMKLFKAVMAELVGVDVALSSQDDFINTFKTAFARVLSSDRIEDALWGCLERATYNGSKINRDTFEDEKIRADFFPVAKEVCEFNLAPFSRNLSSKLLELLSKVSDFRRSGATDSTKPT